MKENEKRINLVCNTKLSPIDMDCIIKHLTKECSYNETGCSDCKGKEKIRIALEKQMPKKPKVHDFKDIMYLQCPICGEMLRINQPFCDGCGQKLDLEDGE